MNISTKTTIFYLFNQLTQITFPQWITLIVQSSQGVHVFLIHSGYSFMCLVVNRNCAIVYITRQFSQYILRGEVISLTSILHSWSFWVDSNWKTYLVLTEKPMSGNSWISGENTKIRISKRKSMKRRQKVQW